MDYLEQ